MVSAAGDVPVTFEFRIGIGADHHTYLETVRIAEAEGAAPISLYACTAAQL
jgi:tRNA-dihydrouridine synthase